jgi:phage/plasmid-like protein (TIGR03299 family)
MPQVPKSFDNLHTIEEAFQQGDLMWETKLGPIYDENGVVIQTHQRTYRSDNDYTLGVVGRRYTPLQNTALMEWAKDVLGTEIACVDMAGHLRGGTLVYVDFLLDSYQVGENEQETVENHLLAINAHDSSRSCLLIPMAKRLYCWNQLNTIYNDSKNAKVFQIKHFASGEARLQEIKRMLSAARYELSFAASMFNNMARVHAPFKDFKSEIACLFQIVQETFDISDEDVKRWEDGEYDRQPAWVEVTRSIETLYQSGPGATAPGVRGTVWGMYNAVSTYLNHHRPLRGDDGEDTAENDDLRLYDNLFGTGFKQKTKAYTAALKFAEAWK